MYKPIVYKSTKTPKCTFAQGLPLEVYDIRECSCRRVMFKINKHYVAVKEASDLGLVSLFNMYNIQLYYTTSESGSCIIRWFKNKSSPAQWTCVHRHQSENIATFSNWKYCHLLKLKILPLSGHRPSPPPPPSPLHRRLLNVVVNGRFNCMQRRCTCERRSHAWRCYAARHYLTYCKVVRRRTLCRRTSA